MEPSEESKTVTPPPSMEGLGWRVSLSIAAGVGWLIFLIVWLFFFASVYNAYQNVAIFLASLLILCFILGTPWAVWGRRHWRDAEREQIMPPGFRWRAWASGIVFVGILVGLIYWFFVYAGGYSIYQNIAIFIIAALFLGGIMGAMWAPWGMKQGRRHP